MILSQLQKMSIIVMVRIATTDLPTVYTTKIFLKLESILNLPIVSIL